MRRFEALPGERGGHVAAVVSQLAVVRGVLGEATTRRSTRLGGSKSQRFDEALVERAAEVVNDDMDAAGGAIDVTDQVLGDVNEADLAATRSHLRDALSAPRL